MRDFFVELFALDELDEASHFFMKEVGSIPLIADFVIFVVGLHFLQKLFARKASLFFDIMITIFIGIYHYNVGKSIIELIQYSYDKGGIAFFRSTIFIGIGIIIFLSFIKKRVKPGGMEVFIIILPAFVFIELMVIASSAVDKATGVYEPSVPFYVVIILTLFVFMLNVSGIRQAEIEDKILNGSANDAEKAAWLESKKDLEYQVLHQHHMREMENG